MKPYTSKVLVNDQNSLHIQIFSEEKADTIILLHGGPGMPDPMTEVGNLLKDFFRVITFDQRGTGDSTCNDCDYTMDEYISDIDCIANDLKLKTFHLFGHSWGGLYAQIYAQERPKKIKSLFLCSPSSGTNSIWKETEKEVLMFNKKSCSNSEWLMMGLNSGLGALGISTGYKNLYKQVLKNYYKGFGGIKIDNDLFDKVHAAAINKTRKQILNYKLLNTFKNLAFPILITYGENDIYGESMEEVHKRFPTAEFTTIYNSGHIPWKHNPDFFNHIVLDFYSKNRKN